MALDEKQDQYTKIEILETICENVIIKQESPWSYTFPEAITIEDGALYSLIYYQLNENQEKRDAAYSIARAADNKLDWLDGEQYPVRMTSTEIKDYFTIHTDSDETERVYGSFSIYKIKIDNILELNSTNQDALYYYAIKELYGYSVASGLCSTAEGTHNIASGAHSHAEGHYCLSSGIASHAEGMRSIASGKWSHAEGDICIASGHKAHAEGNQCVASAQNSHAEGQLTYATGLMAHSEGDRTIAASRAQHAQGQFNIEDSAGTYAHIVGNGSSDGARANAHTLDWNGNAWFAGEVYVGSTSGTNKDEGSVKLATINDIPGVETGAYVGTGASITINFTKTPKWVTISNENGSFNIPYGQTKTTVGFNDPDYAEETTPTSVLFRLAYMPHIINFEWTENSVALTSDDTIALNYIFSASEKTHSWIAFF